MAENKPQDPYYEDVIDLRELVETLLKYKWIILAATLLAALGRLPPASFSFLRSMKRALRSGSLSHLLRWTWNPASTTPPRCMITGRS